MRALTMCVLAGAAFSVLACGPQALATEKPVAEYPLSGDLSGRDAAGVQGAGAITRGGGDQLKYVEGVKNGRGLYLGETAAVSLPVPQFNPQEGTICFWFRPDWAPFSGRAGMIVEIAAEPAYHFRWRKGYAHHPNYCYFEFGDCGGVSAGSYNLFTGRTWRHYAVRWSAQRGRVGFVVDGQGEGTPGVRWSGGFKCATQGPSKANVLFSGEALGAFADVKVFDRFLEDDEVLKAAGLAKAGSYYMQRQRPPRGATGRDNELACSSFVDPNTGQTTTAPLSKEGIAAGVRVYDPAKMPDLPETPHTKWAKPLAGGPVRALMVFPTDFYDARGSLLREAVEIWQRLDLQCEVANRPTPAVMGKDYDVIVVSHQEYVNGWRGWSDLDAGLRQWILDRVTSGRSGLVVAYPMKLDAQIQTLFDPKRRLPSECVLRGFPTQAMHRVSLESHEAVYDLDDGFFESQEDLAGKVVEVYGGDKLRVVKLNYELGGAWSCYPGLTPDCGLNCGATAAHYDYWMALAARAILYAAGRQPAAKITAADVQGPRWTVTVEGTAATLAYRARDIWGREYAQGSLKLQGPSRTSIQGVKLPPRAVVDLWLKDAEGKVLDWYCAAAPPARETKITGIKLDKAAWSKGETVTGKVAVRAKDAGQYRLDVYLADHELRRLVRQEIQLPLAAGEGKEVPLALAIPASSDSLLMRVNALLSKDGAIVDDRSADCPVPRRSFEGFWAVMYGAQHNRHLANLMFRKFRDLFGANAGMHSGRVNYATMARNNLNHVEYAAHLGYPGGADPDYDMTSREHWEEFFPKNAWCDPDKILPFRPIFWSLGEEHYAFGVIPSPTADVRLREYLKRKYGTLERLNAIWGAAYASWDEVKVPDLKKPETTAKIKHDGIRRFELSCFTDHVFADRHAYLAEYFRKLDPGGEVGIHAGWDLWMGRGYDYWLLSRGMEAMSGYEGLQNQYIRSFFKHYYGSFYHYRPGSEEDARWYPWHLLANGAHGMCYYAMTPEVVWGAYTADLHFSSDWLAGAPEYKAVAELGQLLARSEYQQDQVAIHYSQDSFHAGVAYALSYIHESFVNLLLDAGVPLRFVSYQQLAEGEMAKTPYRLLILPHSVSLSAAEAKAIRAYVEQGGTVWADVVPGIFDNFAQPLPQSQLADVFANLQDAPLPGGKTLKLGKYGRGAVILGDIGNYMYPRNVGSHLPIQEMLDKVADTAKIHRVARVVNRADGKLANGVWTSGYASGSHRYVLAVKDHRLVDRNNVDARIELGTKGHVYEMRSGKYFGETDRIDVELEPTRGKVFSILPYRVNDLKTEAPGQAAGGRDLTVRIRLDATAPVGKQDQHVVRVSVLRPDGQEETALRRLAVIRGGEGDLSLPVAYDDVAGKWTVVLKDIATGMEKRLSYIIQ